MARFSIPLPVVTLTSLALVLTACGGGEVQKNTQVPETPFTPPAATSSASVSSSVAPSAQAAESPAPSSSAPVALPTLASGKTVEFTPEELAAYQKGEYVPASEKHPAYNVPVPVMPEVAKTQTAEGAVAFVEYWRETFNYMFKSGNSELFREINDAIGMEKYVRLADMMDEVRSNKEWFLNVGVGVEVSSVEGVQQSGNSAEVIVEYTLIGGTSYKATGELDETFEGDHGKINILRMFLRYEEGKWKAYSIGGA